MVRTINAKGNRSLAKGERAVLLPGATSAEPWESWIVGAAKSECVRACARPSENPLRRTSALILPVAKVYCLPLWVNETDPKAIAEMIPMQLEVRGLQPRASVAVFDYSVVTQEAARTLVSIGILPSALPEDIRSESCRSFDVSARYFPLPEDALTLWREQDDWVVAITRGPHLAYFQSLGPEAAGARLLQDLRCILSSLKLREIIAPLREIMIWEEANASDLSVLEPLRLPLMQADRPLPRVPSSPWKLVPMEVTQARAKREARRWQVRGAFFALAAYLVAVGWMVAQVVMLSARVNELEHWTAQHGQELELVHGTRNAWKDLRPVVDEKSYPLELLLHTARDIPGDQLHLTLFESGDGHLLIKGEALNASAAFKFLDKLKKDPDLDNYTWQMGQPHLLPNDLAQFQVDGTRGSGGFP